MDELDFASLLGDEANSHFAGISHFKVQRICDPVSSLNHNESTLARILTPNLLFLTIPASIRVLTVIVSLGFSTFNLT